MRRWAVSRLHRALRSSLSAPEFRSTGILARRGRFVDPRPVSTRAEPLGRTRPGKGLRVLGREPPAPAQVQNLRAGAGHLCIKSLPGRARGTIGLARVLALVSVNPFFPPRGVRPPQGTRTAEAKAREALPPIAHSAARFETK